MEPDEDVPMQDAAPSLFTLDVDMKSALDDLPFTGPQRPALPQVTKPRFEPKLKARGTARGRPPQAAPPPPVLKPAAATVAVKEESELEALSPKFEQVPGQFLDFDYTLPTKEDAGFLPVHAGPKEEEDVIGADIFVLPEAVVKKEEILEDVFVQDRFADDGEDRVVREIDVFLRPTLEENTQLYLLQYPHRPSWRPYGMEERCEQVRVKPLQSKLEIDLIMETEGENYDDSAPEHLKIKKQTLTSTRSPLSTSYAVGILQGNKLYVNPLHAIVQLRPSMAYLDEADAVKKSNAGTTDGDEKMVDAEGDPSEDLVALQVKVRRRETERQEEIRLHSFEYLQKLDSAEPWVTLDPHGRNSQVTVDIRHKMKSSAESSIAFDMLPQEYLKTLVPGRASSVAVEVLGGDGVGNAGLSRSFLDTLPLKKRLQVLLSRGRVHVLQFDRLMKLAPAGCTEHEVLAVLQDFALLVQGCWVASSPLRYSGPITAVRDYILLLFTKSRVVHHQQLEELRVPKEMVREVLLSLAVQRGAAAGWEFQESTDKSFLKRHQAIAKEAAQRWASAEAHIRNSALQLNTTSMDEVRQAKLEIAWVEEDGKAAGQVHSSGRNEAALVRGQRGAPSAVKSISRDREKGSVPGPESGEVANRPTMSAPTLAALPGALREIFAKHSVCSLQFLCQCLREMAITKSASNSNPRAAAEAVAAAQGANAPMPELAAVVSKVASSIEGVYFLTSLGIPQVDPFRECVIQLLRTKGSTGGGLRKTDVMEASKILCKRECPPATYLRIMKELCYSKGGTWVLKPGDGRPT